MGAQGSGPGVVEWGSPVEGRSEQSEPAEGSRQGAQQEQGLEGAQAGLAQGAPGREGPSRMYADGHPGESPGGPVGAGLGDWGRWNQGSGQHTTASRRLGLGRCWRQMGWGLASQVMFQTGAWKAGLTGVPPAQMGAQEKSQTVREGLGRARCWGTAEKRVSRTA